MGQQSNDIRQHVTISPLYPTQAGCTDVVGAPMLLGTRREIQCGDAPALADAHSVGGVLRTTATTADTYLGSDEVIPRACRHVLRTEVHVARHQHRITLLMQLHTLLQEIFRLDTLRIRRLALIRAFCCHFQYDL